ncbi:dienelactone hydrolase family protein [Cedecea lapagei]|uniref:dienelactone hydrolase family protein n=1 Tax=Cedecea lapagei TaxID=158823 RepID=UPI001BD12E3D|nr:dienelactone hydrolase family protein [Cedecea lapagei]
MSEIISTTITYQVENQTFESVLVYQENQSAARPGILIAPNWMGVSAGAVEQAKGIAAQGYVVLVADLYGQGKRPTNADEAGALMMGVKDTPAEVGRMQAALDTLATQKIAAVDGSKLAVAGFCFGGHCALELARSGADIKAAVSFHGTLNTLKTHAAGEIKASILVLDGAEDPLVPREQLSEFVSEMNAASVDWQLVSYAGAVHSFTDPGANVEGVAKYHPEVAKRAFTQMYTLLQNVFN